MSSSSSGRSPCPECGAIAARGKTCRERYDEILALEFERPAIFGAVHHITVICYNLQHPSSFTKEAIEWMELSLRAIIEEGLSPEELRKRAIKKFRGSGRVLRHEEPKEMPRRILWSVTVLDISTIDPETYIEDITAWARSILRDLA